MKKVCRSWLVKRCAGRLDPTHRGKHVAILLRVQLIVPAMANLEVAVNAGVVGGILRLRRLARAKVALCTGNTGAVRAGGAQAGASHGGGRVHVEVGGAGP